MKNVMIVALLSVGICVAGEAAHNAVGVPLQVPVIVAMAAAAAHGNNEQVHVQKPKRSSNAKRPKEHFNRPTREKNSFYAAYKKKR